MLVAGGAAMAGLVSAATMEVLQQEEGASKTHLPLKNLKGLKTVLLVLSVILEITVLEVLYSNTLGVLWRPGIGRGRSAKGG